MPLNLGFTYDDVTDKAAELADKARGTVKGAAEQFKDKPSKAVIALLRGMARTTAAAPGDLLDLIAEHATPPGTRSPKAGDTLRRWLDKTPLAADESPAEKIGEFTGAPRRAVKGADRADIMGSADAAIKSGQLHPMQLAAALKMKKQGRPDDEIWAQTRVQVATPGVLPGAKTYPMTAIETPGYSQGGWSPKGGATNETLAQRLLAGDIKGMENVLKMHPSMAKTKIIKEDTGNPNVLGSYNPLQDRISLNYGAKHHAEFPEVLAHEGSHTMAEKAGTPGGASVQGAAQKHITGQKVFVKAEKDAHAAFLARSLAEDRGLFSRGYPGGPSANPLEVAMLYKSVYGRMGPTLTPHAMKLALMKTPEELHEHSALINRLLGKIAPDPYRGYLTEFGESGARTSQWQAGRPLHEIQQNPPGTVGADPVRRTELLWEDRDFDPALWKQFNIR